MAMEQTEGVAGIKAGEPASEVERNKALVRRFVDEVFVKGSLEAVDELVADDFTPHTWPSVEDKAGVKRAVEHVHAVLTQMSMTIEDLIAEGDRVAVRVTARGVQAGPFMGLPPSGKGYVVGEIHLFRLRAGKVVEHWHQADLLGMFQQLEADPRSPAHLDP
ncbi:MAG: ester cyclase [Deltaproteobacteria bacterium]|nr:ester cyclase [Deltaproteobacteria bacterium]